MPDLTTAGRRAVAGPVLSTPRRRVLAALAAACATALFGSWIAVSAGGPSSAGTFDDIGTVAAAAVAALACLHAGLSARGNLRRFWLLMGAACTAWTLAEVLWAEYDLLLHVPVPVPSTADVGYLSAIPLAVAALLSHPAMTSARAERRRWTAVLDGTVVATALTFLSWVFVLGPRWRQTDLSELGGIVSVACPFGDVVMLLLVVLVIRRATDVDRFALWCVLGGLSAMAVADSTYSYLATTGRYSTGDPVDTGWIAAYLLLALAGLSSREGAVAERPAAAEAAGWPALLVPFVPVLLALVTVAAEMELGHRLPLVDWLLALALVVLVLARQVVLVERLRRSPGLAPRSVPSSPVGGGP